MVEIAAPIAFAAFLWWSTTGGILYLDSLPARTFRVSLAAAAIVMLVGFLVLQVAGPQAWAAAVAVGLAIVAMHLTRTFHPPAGINPLLIVVNALPWSFIAVPVGAGALLLAAFAFVWHNSGPQRNWPARWW